MRVRVDRERCQGHARCWTESPDLFVLDDDGYSDVDDAMVPAGREAEARRAALGCPERAISVIEEA